MTETDASSTQPTLLNAIPEMQNSERLQRLQRAKSAVYDSAQRWYYGQFAINVGVVLVLALLKLLVPEAADVWATMGLLAALADTALVDRMVESRRERGAKFQELFDCELFRLPWREGKLGKKPAAEEIEEWARKAPLTDYHRNWYAPEVGELPPDLARVACQRSNGGWSSRMRRRYARLLLGAGSALLIVTILVGLVSGAPLRTAGAWLAMLSPFWVWALRESNRQWKSANASEKLVDRADRLWRAGLADPEFSVPEQDVRELQNDIFDQRRRDQPVLGAVYWRHRDADEQLMRVGVTDLVGEYRAAVAVGRR